MKANIIGRTARVKSDVRQLGGKEVFVLCDARRMLLPAEVLDDYEYRTGGAYPPKTQDEVLVIWGGRHVALMSLSELTF